MITSTNLRNKVQQKVNERHREIIMGVYLNMIKSHNDFCGCNYCKILVEYVQLKKYRTALDRRMNSHDYDYWDSRATKSDLQDLSIIKQNIRMLKKQKDSLKTL